MDAATLFFIQKKLSNFESLCSMITNQAATARTLLELARLSNHAPHADPIIRFMPEVKRANYRLEVTITDRAMALLDEELKRVEAQVQTSPESKQELLGKLMRDVRFFSGHNPMVVSRGLDTIQRHPVNRIKQASSL